MRERETGYYFDAAPDAEPDLLQEDTRDYDMADAYLAGTALDEDEMEQARRQRKEHAA